MAKKDHRPTPYQGPPHVVPSEPATPPSAEGEESQPLWLGEGYPKPVDPVGVMSRNISTKGKAVGGGGIKMSRPVGKVSLPQSPSAENGVGSPGDGSTPVSPAQVAAGMGTKTSDPTRPASTMQVNAGVVPSSIVFDPTTRPMPKIAEVPTIAPKVDTKQPMAGAEALQQGVVPPVVPPVVAPEQVSVAERKRRARGERSDRVQPPGALVQRQDQAKKRQEPGIARAVAASKGHLASGTRAPEAGAVANTGVANRVAEARESARPAQPVPVEEPLPASMAMVTFPTDEATFGDSAAPDTASTVGDAPDSDAGAGAGGAADADASDAADASDVAADAAADADASDAAAADVDADAGETADDAADADADAGETADDAADADADADAGDAADADADADAADAGETADADATDVADVAVVKKPATKKAKTSKKASTKKAASKKTTSTKAAESRTKPASSKTASKKSSTKAPSKKASKKASKKKPKKKKPKRH